MADYFLYFRCWPGFSEPFPFEQFNALPDDELPRALGGFAGEQLQIPRVRKQIKEVGRDRRRRFVNSLNDKWKRRSPGNKAVTRWMGHAVRQKCWRRVRGAGREDPLVCRLGSYLGWWTDTKVNGRAVGFPMVWFCLSPSLALAEHLVEELNRQRCLDYDKHEIEHLANPRYSFVSAEGLSLGKRASILRRINAIREGREPDVQDGKLALLIGQRSLRVALDVAEAWPIDEDKELLAAEPTDAAPQVGPVADPVETAETGGNVPAAEEPGENGGAGDAAEEIGSLSPLDRLCIEALEHFGKPVNQSSLRTLEDLSAARKFYLVCWHWKESEAWSNATIRDAFRRKVDASEYALPDKGSGSGRVKTGTKRGPGVLDLF